MMNCVFCKIVAGTAPATIVREWDDAIAIRPRSGGVNDSHVMVIPKVHVQDAGEDPAVTAMVMGHAAELMAEMDAANIITSKGADATQTVFHLHVHVLKRVAGDGLPLPWTPQHKARAAAKQRLRWTTVTTTLNMKEPALMSSVNLVMARETYDPAAGPSVFLAGPTPDRSNPVPSWRPQALKLLDELWTGDQPLTVLSPESRDGRRAERYEHQVDWETAARADADAVLFWIPRDLKALPGFTTNVEFGLDAPSGRVVLGCPPDCPDPQRNRYLIYVAGRHGVPVRKSLRGTIEAALDTIAG